MSNQKKQFRKFTATAATATFVASAFAPIAFADSSKFADVSERYADSTEFLVSKGAKGLSATEFGVHKNITRADAAVLLVNVLELDENAAPASGFTDVPARAVKAVNALKAAGITSGKSEKLFGSQDNITRGEFALWMQKAFVLKGASADSSFKDVGTRYKEAIEALIGYKIANGISNTEFGTASLLKRGDFANLLYKAYNETANVWAVKLSMDKDKVVADGSSEVEVTVELVHAKTGEAATHVSGLSLELTSTNGSITPKPITLENGKAKVTLKSDLSYEAGKATIDAKVTEAAGVFKAVVGKSLGSGSIDLDAKDHGENFLLSVMHTNDTHSHVEAAPKMVTAVKEVRAAKPHALLVDAGDALTGTLYFNEFAGEPELKLFNLLKYDMMTLGNHEFDLGSSTEGHKALAEFIKGAKFPIISANVNASKDALLKDLFVSSITATPDNGKVFDGIVKTINGEKVGFFGLTTEETKSISSPVEVTFSNYIEEAKAAVKAFEDLGINKIVAVTHLGYDDNPEVDNDLLLAQNVPGIDLIIGGHSHTQLDQPVAINKDSNDKAKDPTLIVQAYQYNNYLGTIDVEFDKDGKVVGYAGKLINVSDKKADSEASDLLKPYSEKVEKTKQLETGGIAAKALDNPRGDDGLSVRKNETELGNLITDSMLAKAKEYNPETVIALQNGGGIRAEIDAGPITLGEVLTTLPFGNTLATMKLKGSEILLALEHSVRSYPRESGGFLHVSGMKFTFDSTKSVGSRVLTAEVQAADGKYAAIKADQEYVVATNYFTAKGGDGYDVLKTVYEAGRVTDLGISDWEVLRGYLSANKNIDPKIEGRIVHVEK